jgi:hypothetical protein
MPTALHPFPSQAQFPAPQPNGNYNPYDASTSGGQPAFDSTTSPSGQHPILLAHLQQPQHLPAVPVMPPHQAQVPAQSTEQQHNNNVAEPTRQIMAEAQRIVTSFMM